MFPCYKCKMSFECNMLLRNHMKNKHFNDYVTLIENKLKTVKNEDGLEPPKETTDTEMKNSNEKFRFPGVKLCDKCGAVV